MSNKLRISEVLTSAGKLLTKAEKVKYLQDNTSPALRDILRINFDDDIISLLPEGSPPYKVDEAPDDSSWSDLHREYKLFAYFFKGRYSSMKQSKRESMFVQLLEKLHPSEAALVCAAKDKSIKYKGITKIMIKDAFPNLLKL
jgi:hypothetical protein|tara:strand:- start:2178 stop:2606 length:429 start_codon:yes stop_codon:yes gene_type:complete